MHEDATRFLSHSRLLRMASAIREYTATRSGEPGWASTGFNLGRGSWARLALPWTLVTNDSADEGELVKFGEVGVQVEVTAVGGA